MPLALSKKHIRPELKVKIDNKDIQQGTEAKYLGVIMDENLSWAPHVQKVEKKVASSCWALKAISEYVTRDVMKKIYFGIIYAHLFYCISCWGSVPSSRSKKLFTLQKRAVRTIEKVPVTTSSSALFKNLNFLKLQDIYSLRLATIMYKINNGTWMGNTEFKKVSSIHKHFTRSSASDRFYTPKVKTNAAKNSFYYMGPKVYSEIPLSIRKLPINSFKKEVCKRLMQNY